MLYGRLHGLLRKQIVDRVPAAAASSGKSKGGLSNSAASPIVPPVMAEEKHLSPVAVVTSPCVLEPVASSRGKR